MAKVLPAADVKDRFMELLRELEATHEEVLITQDGALVAKVVAIDRSATVHSEEWQRKLPPDPIPPEQRLPREALLGTVTFHGDIMEPLDEEWDAEK